MSLRNDANQIIQAALAAAMPDAAVAKALESAHFGNGRVVLVAAGKAAWQMAKAASDALGSRIEAFHVHDNDGKSDQHLAPYMGVLDWNRFVEGLKAIDYHGALSFETFGAVSTFDPALAPQVLRLIAQTGRMFAERAGV